MVATSLPGAGELMQPLLEACEVAILVAPVESPQAATALRMASRDAGLMAFERGHRLIVVEGSSPLDDDEIRIETGMHVAGRLPAIDEGRLLSLQNNRRDRPLLHEFDAVVERVRNLFSLHAEAGTDPLDGAGRPRRLESIQEVN